ncbi:MAG: PaaI family thioesterase [Proteobacteria bacterium]|nr:PaaI family thioesterase [Pseudomonadota bacterium]
MMMAQGGAPFFQAVGGQIVESEPGRSLMRLPYSPFIVGNPDTGVVHGGVITGMLDHACGMAVGSQLGALSATPGAMRSIATLDLRIDYMKAAKPDADIFIVGECVKVTRQIVFARGRAYQDEDDTVATATAAFIITDMKS